jgi:O-antigen/teichoic acid export membrane protein
MTQMAVSDSSPKEIPPKADASSTDHVKERNQKLRRNVYGSMVARAASVLVPLVVVPFLFRYLGKEIYGVYELLGVFAVWVGMGNSGLTSGLMNFLVVCYAEHDYKKARELISTFLVASIVLLGVLALAGFAAAFTVPWARLLKLSAGSETQGLPWAAALTIVCSLLMVFCGILDAVYGAFQNFAAISFWDAMSKIVATCAVVGVTYTQMGLTGAILAGIGIPAAIKLAGVFDLFRHRLPEVRPRFGLYRSQYLRPLLVDGALLLVGGAAFGGVFQIDKMFLGVISGSAVVAQYSILAKLYLSAFGMYSLIFRLLWPAFGEAIHRKDFDWVKKWLMLALILGVLIVTLASGLLLFFGKWIFRVWLGKGGNGGLVPSIPIVIGFTSWFLVYMWASSYSTVLNAARVLGPQFLLIGSHAILTVLIMPFLIRQWGMCGAACAPFIAGLPTSAWGFPWLVHRYVFRRE